MLSDATETLPGLPAPGAPKISLTGRERILEQIAERYWELVDPLNGPGGVRGDGDSPVQMPRTYTHTVREFERLAKQLHRERFDLWKHLDGWWLSATTRTINLCPTCGPCHQDEHIHHGRKDRKLRSVKCRRVMVWNRKPGAQASGAGLAIRWMAEHWALKSEPFLPDELRIAA
jgi:hypothetical protein